MTSLYLDIETVPCQDPRLLDAISADKRKDLDAATAAVKAPANYKDPQKIAEYIIQARIAMLESHAEDVAKAIERTSFDGGLGRVCVIGWAVNGSDARSVAIDLADSEQDGLREAFDAIGRDLSDAGRSRPQVIGHNVAGFDLPFLHKRAIVLDVRPPMWLPPLDFKPWDDRIYDTMTRWAGARERISLDRLCTVLGLPGKDGISGADVWPMVQAGRLNEVARYCEGDVDRVRRVHLRMTFGGDS